MLSLQQLVAEELAVPVRPEIADFAAHIAAAYPGAARAVLFYGSCLRSEQLAGEMLDFYLIVSDYDRAYAKAWQAKWNRRLPPNVFPFQFGDLMAKVAVLDEADFHSLNRPAASAVSVWARFSQPSRLVWAVDDIARRKVILSVSGAAPTLLNAALSHIDREGDILDLWQYGYAMTYGAELRAERKGRSASVIEYDPERYERFGHAALHHTMIPNAIRGGKIHLLPDPERRAERERARWPALRRRGKLLTIARLAKAAFTYTGGIDYLAWKINRHAGTDIQLSDWQRRWPFFAAVMLLPKLLAKGAIK
ncbi:MAG: hypothetical protein KAZ17_02320 [Sphingorhabdus sp.]|nr:hypothetical protein [Sphingorhabdus sp.]